MNDISRVYDSWEVPGKKSVFAIFLGMAIIAASIVLGRSFVFFGGFLVFSVLITLLWRKYPRPWVFLVSTVAATPVMIAKYQFSCNVIFAFWSAIFNVRYFFKIPKWLYALTALAVLGILTSSIHWLSGDVIRSIMRQVTFAFNFILAPFLLIPLIYVRMRESTDHAANLQGLLFCLIIPATLILVAARLFGTVANSWEASQHAQSLSEGFYVYQLGKVLINFSRTDVGFILAALFCASTSIVVSPVRMLQRVLAGACLVSSVFLLLSTGSFGSIFACLCGLAAIFIVQYRTINIAKLIVSMAIIIGVLFLIYALLPSKTKEYLGKRYEHRVENQDTDRLYLWSRAMDYFLDHPGGVGYTLMVGDDGSIKTWTHNEYLAYAVSYGVAGALAYASYVSWLLLSFILKRKQVFDDPSAIATYLAGLSVLVAIAVNSMTDHLSGDRMNYNIIWSLIWYCYFCSCAGQRKTVLRDETQFQYLDNNFGISAEFGDQVSPPFPVH